MIHCHSMGPSSEQNSSLGGTVLPPEEQSTGQPTLKEAPPVEEPRPIPEAPDAGAVPSVAELRSVKEAPPVAAARPIPGATPRCETTLSQREERHRTDTADLQRTNLLLQLHLQEYQALTNRGTNWLALESGVLALMLIFLSVVPSLSKDARIPDDLLVWGALFALQLLALVWTNLMYDHYSSIQYIEFDLRRSITHLIGKGVFWRYERFMRRRRPKSQPFWWELAPSFLVFAIYPLIISYRLMFASWVPREYLEIGINLVVSYVFVWASVRMIKVRRHLTKLSVRTDETRT